MSLKRAVVVLVSVTLCAVESALPASAQYESCVDTYNRVMALYQSAPYSPEYSQLSAYYSSRCLGGPVAGPAYPAPGPYPGPYAAPPAIDPGAAIVGGILGGLIIGGALQRDRRHDRRHDRGYR